MSVLNYFNVYDIGYKIRLGNKSDGGYVIADNIGDYDVYLSAGIGEDESFSNDFLKKYKVLNNGAFQFDINRLPHNFPKNLIFYKKNISDISDDKNANLKFFINNYNNIFLKMDIEGCEFLWFNSLTIEDLKKFKQLVVEFHGINDDSFGYSHQIKLDVFNKLSQTHYLIHAHGNNFCIPLTSNIDGKNVPNIIELTYVRKDIIPIPNLNKIRLPNPHGLDFPCNTNAEDINLNFIPFVYP
jgi:hypothetical protein